MTLDSLLLATALAHAPGESGPVAGPTWTAADLAVIVPLGLSGGVYIAGLSRLWRQAGVGRGISGANAACFAAGWLTMALALLSPLHDLGERLFAAHMVQHILLIAIGAPLLVLGRPGGAMSWGLPKDWRGAAGNIVRARPVVVAWSVVTRPLIATALHGATIWAWHLPVLFDAALSNPWLHWLEHASFVLTAALFWWAMLGRPARVNGYGMSVACLFVTLLHSSFLGMLLTLSPQPWYAPAPAAAEWGLTPMEDQQLAGLIMWIPGGILYTLAALALAGLWITQSAKPARTRA